MCWGGGQIPAVRGAARNVKKKNTGNFMLEYSGLYKCPIGNDRMIDKAVGGTKKRATLKKIIATKYCEESLP